MSTSEGTNEASFDAYRFFLCALNNALHACNDEGPNRAILCEALRCANAGWNEIVSSQLDRRGPLLRLSAEHLERAASAPGDERGAGALFIAHRAGIAALFEHEARRTATHFPRVP